MVEIINTWAGTINTPLESHLEMREGKLVCKHTPGKGARQKVAIVDGFSVFCDQFKRGACKVLEGDKCKIKKDAQLRPMREWAQVSRGNN